MADDTVFLAHVDEMEELGWNQVAERMNQWARNDHVGNWQDPAYEPEPDWSWPDFMRWLS